MKMNNRGQFSIIAALLVAVILVGTVISTYSSIRYSTLGDQPQVLNAVDEVNLAIRQLLGFTVGYYGSILQVTGNSTYAKSLASTYLNSGLENIADLRPEQGLSFNVTSIVLQVNWFATDSYSSGQLNIKYDLTGLGLQGLAYSPSCRLDVHVLPSVSGDPALINVFQDGEEPLTTLASTNFKFFKYDVLNQTWGLVTLSTTPEVTSNGTYSITVPAGIDSSSYVVQLEDTRGIMVVGSSFNGFTSTLTWNSTYADGHYVDVDTSNVDNSSDQGTHSNFPAQQSAPSASIDTLKEGITSTSNPNYYPLWYNNITGTLLSGSVANLAADDSVKMTFQPSGPPSQALFVHQETTNINGVSYYTLKSNSGDASGSTLSAQMSSSRISLGKAVYSLQGVSSIPANTWTMNYRGWQDAATNIALDGVAAGQSVIVSYIPITLTNNQASATPSTFQQKITWNPSSYTSYEASNLGNIRFFSDSAFTTQLYGWIESCTPSLSNTATSASAWIKLTSSIAGSGGTKTIYMAFLSTATAYDVNYWGTAPNLSGTYGQYDNGANVFNFYDNFVGTTLNAKWTTVKNSFASVAVNNGVTFTASSSSGYGFVVSAAQTYPNVAETYLVSSTSGVNPMLGVSTTTSVNSWVALYNGYSLDETTSVLALVSETSGGGSNVATRSVSGINTGIWQLTWSATGSETASDGVYTLNGASSSPTIANYRIYIGLSNYGSGNDVFRWARMRAYPPSNVMPSVSLGSTSFSNSLAWSHTTSSGSNRIMIVGASIKSSSVSVSSITYGGQSLTFIRRDTNANGIRSELWYLIAPASGTATITISLSGNALVTGSSITYTGVAQSSPIDANNGGSGTSSTPSQSVTVNTANSMLISNIAINGSSSVSSEGAGQTQRWDQYYTNLMRGHGSEEGPDATGSQSVSWTLSASANWAASVAALKPASISASGKFSVDIIIRQSSGAVRSTISDVAASQSLTSSPQTLTGTYAWSSYAVVSQTDYLEFDYYVDITTIGSLNAYLRIDDNSLSPASQTSISNIMFPGGYSLDVEFGKDSSDLTDWNSLVAIIDSSSTSNVNATFKLYNYQASRYPTNGEDGYLTTIIGSSNVTKNITTSNPANFRDPITGAWKLEVDAENATSATFNMSFDLVRFTPTDAYYGLDLEEQWASVEIGHAQYLCIKTGNFSGGDTIMVDVWNNQSGTAHWDSLYNTTSPLVANTWNNVSVIQYLTSSTFTIRFRSNDTLDTQKSSWNISSVMLRLQPDLGLLLSLQDSTTVVEWLQNGTMRWLGQNLQLTSQADPIPPIPVKAIHMNQTFVNGTNREVPFQVEDWASSYRIPLGLTSNATVFSNRQMVVFLLNTQVSKVSMWWNGSDMAAQTPYAYRPGSFSDNPSSNTLNNGKLAVSFGGGFSVTSSMGTSSSVASFMRINGFTSDYGAGLAYVITNAPVRDIVQQEAEWGGSVLANNCPNIYANMVLTLPAGTSYYTYQLRLMFINSTGHPRTITDLSPIQLSTSISVIQTENDTLGTSPIVASGTAAFKDYGSQTAHHWSQFIDNSTGIGAGIMFTNTANQQLYAFDPPTATSATGTLNVNATSKTIEISPVTKSMGQVASFLTPNTFDITWYGAVATFNGGATPIYKQNPNGSQSGLWILVEYQPQITVNPVR